MANDAPTDAARAAFSSRFTVAGKVTLPPFQNTRVLLMPFLLHDLASLPPAVARYREVVAAMREVGGIAEGTAYLTVDERLVPAGRTHRRPGLHVDGWTDDVDDGGWGGGSWGVFGWLTLSSHAGCVAYEQEFYSAPARYGNCVHLTRQCRSSARELLEPNRIYKMQNLTVHDSVPLQRTAPRQFVRLSLPSKAGWPTSCTRNPLGVPPAGKLLPPRPRAFTVYDPCSERPHLTRLHAQV